MNRVFSAHKAPNIGKKPSRKSEDASKLKVAVAKKLNQHYALVGVGGDFVIVEPEQRPPVMRTDAAMKKLFANKKVSLPSGDGSKEVSEYSIWFTHPTRREYKRAVFDPSDSVWDDEFNLYRGFDIKPCPGDWTLFRRHLFYNVCGGNSELFYWFIAFFAQLYQRPGDKQGTAIVLQGGRGTGKSMAAKWLARPFGHHALTISQPEQVLGRFNAHLATAVFLVMEEGFWAGDKKYESILKDLITGGKMMLEQKGIDAIQVDNHIHLMILSNSRWVIPAGEDERRYLFLTIRTDQQKNVEYFAAIDKEMSHGGVEAMLYDLLQYRFHEVDLRNPPVTDGLVEQKLSSLSSEMSWLYDVLLTGQLSPDSREVWPEGWMRFDKTTVYQSYADHTASRSKGFVMDRALFGRFLAKSLPGLKEVRPTGVGGARIQMYEFPPLDQIRAAFTASTGISFITDDGERLVDSRTSNAKAAEHVEDVDYAGRWNVLSARDFVRERPDTGPNAWFAAAA